MLYRLAAHGVVAVHVAYIAFVATGALLARRWPRLVWPHAVALAWAVAGLAVGVPCPLTPLEKHLRRLAGDEVYPGGFVDHYLEGVLYPAEWTPVLWLLAAAAIVAGYTRLLRMNESESP